MIVVALVVIGPKDLPKMLRKLGQYSGKLRRMASELRAQSGIDDALRTEGLADDIAEIRKLARGELDAVQRAAVDISGPSGGTGRTPETSAYRDDFFVVRDREYPRDGADGYGALPDNAIVYAEGLPKSKWARDPIYVLGDPDGIVPEPEPPPAFPEDLGPTVAPTEATGDPVPERVEVTDFVPAAAKNDSAVPTLYGMPAVDNPGEHGAADPVAAAAEADAAAAREPEPDTAGDPAPAPARTSEAH